MKKFCAALLILLFWAVPACAETLAVIDQQGLMDLVARNRGKVVFLNFFATWCPPCRAEIPEIIKVFREYPTDRVLMVGLCVDEDISLVLPFIKKYDIPYPVYLAGKDVTAFFGVSSVPHNVFYDRQGDMVVSAPGMAAEATLREALDDLLNQNH